ncbi:MAG: ABC transporter substrate-binding protein [Protaetiibacter sp.]
MRTRTFAAVAGIVAVTIGMAGCSSAGDGGPVDAGDCSAYAGYGTFDDATVTMYSAIVAPQDAAYIQSFEQFEACTGITVRFQGDKEFDSQIQVRIEGGDAPDVAVFAQPGIVRQLVADGKIVAAPDGVAANLDEFWSDSWKTYVEFDGTVYGAPLGANVKSLVWYSPKRFAEAGWEVPTTLDELKKLSDTIADTGAKPWCDGIGAGDATGWPVTDWMEEMMLRHSGADVYDQWVNHEIPFNSEAPTEALDAVGDYLRNPDYVNGGLGDVTSIASTAWQDAGLPVVAGQCAMYRQGSFYGGFWPEGTDVSENGDVFAFYLPSVDDSAKPVLGGGEFLVAFSDRPEVQAFQEFMSSDTWANAMVAANTAGGWVTANTGMDASQLKNPIDRLSAETLQDPHAVFRYDGSDQMPPAVGTVSFWKNMTDWILGKSTADALTAVEASWPAG